MDLNIDCISHATIHESYDRIAADLFNKYLLQVNHSYYRLIDIEFYYWAEGVFEDVYAHKHPHHLQSGKWYFHGSGLDITIGNNINHGGILIRAVAKLSNESILGYHILKEVHGPINVKTEICSDFYNIDEDKTNTFRLVSNKEQIEGNYAPADLIIKTKRIGLNPVKDPGQQFYNGNFRYVIWPYLKLKNKTQIAKDMKEQFKDMSDKEINKALGSKFL